MQKVSELAHARLLAVFALLFAAWSCLALISGVAYADDSSDEDEDALTEPKVVTVADDPSIPASRDYVTYEKTSENYQVILCGVTDANKDTLADAILANLDESIPVKFVNGNFVDAEKYSTTCETFDRMHCWLGSTSNILTFTGWAKRYASPITSLQFTDEDDLFSFMSSSFSDAGCLPDRAYSYFFDGMFGGTRAISLRTTASTANKPFAGTTHTGFDTALCSAAFVKHIKLDSTLTSLSALEGLKDYALEMGISGDTSHSVTVTGAVIDTSKQGADRYVAILIADTDNEPSTSDQPPATFAEANAAKKAKTNSYTLYHLGTAEYEGQTQAVVCDYMARKKNTFVGNFTQVSYYSDAVTEAATETSANATRNAKTTGDITLESLSCFDENVKTLDAYGTDAKITLQAIIMGLNADVAFDKETTGHDYLENRVEVYRDGELVGTVDKESWLSLENGISSTSGEYLNLDLSGYDFMHEPGNYTLKFYLNTGGIAQAYTLDDNAPQTVSFTLTGSDDSTPEATDPTQTDVSDDGTPQATDLTQTEGVNDATSTTSTTSTSGHATTQATAQTGDPSSPAIIVFAAVVAGAACTVRRLVRIG